MHKHPILIALLLVALAAAGCVAGQPISPADMAAVAPTVAQVVSQLVPQLAGTYTVQASDGAGNSHELSLKLSPDGSVELVTELADATQLMESGTWLLSGEGDVVISLGTEGQSIIEPRTIRLAVEGDELVATDSVTGGQLRLAPGMMAAQAAVATPEAPVAAPAAPADASPTVESITFVSSQPAADSPGLERSLTFNQDGMASMTSDYLNGQPPIVEEGTWVGNQDGTVTLTLTGQQGGQPYPTPVAITFAMLDGSLVAVDYDSELYGSEGLTMQLETPAAEAPAEAEAPASDETAAEVDATLFQTYLSLSPAADGPALLRALALNTDGTATMTSDYYNDQPLIVEDGTWTENADGTITLTLTGQDGQKYPTPDVITFDLVDDTLTAVEYDQDLYGSAGLTMKQAADVALAEKAALVSIDLQAGFPLDPTFVSVNAGGDLNAAVIDADCTGYINKKPVVTVNWMGETDSIKVFFVSDDDPTLVVLAPDGQIYCSDDANEQLLDPVVELQNPMEGQYRIWAGSYARNQLIPGVLVMTASPDVTLGTFDLGSFIKRPLLPDVLEAPAPAVEMDSLLAAVQARVAKAQLQKLGGALAGPIKITADGEIPLFQLPLNNPSCNGLVNEEPDHVFDWAGASDALNLYFEGDGDATLLVLGPDQSVSCSDDAAETGNLNPQVILSNPVAGTYAVWIGRVHPDTSVTGALTITADGSALPAMLEAGQ